MDTRLITENERVFLCLYWSAPALLELFARSQWGYGCLEAYLLSVKLRGYKHGDCHQLASQSVDFKTKTHMYNR
jgi:hypothetical protein